MVFYQKKKLDIFKMCNENFEFCLDSKCVKNLPLDKYEKDFTFIVNGRRYQTSRIVADLMSPQIRKFHYVDPSIDEFVININIQNSESDYFDEYDYGYKCSM